MSCQISKFGNCAALLATGSRLILHRELLKIATVERERFPRGSNPCSTNPYRTHIATGTGLESMYNSQRPVVPVFGSVRSSATVPVLESVRSSATVPVLESACSPATGTGLQECTLSSDRYRYLRVYTL
ncbi:uncharacterized protein PGTG_22282 [Puccinia graminis f. sp. tritici CRL 75-36-700-3]|uniref:Uncharacterized protein n=1 Tax=Puccinia graminis f. sp. tritici (strain CRL 75-36-700-3 / race SCCL) TaxID=418459 RepID=H6QU96_PUCGT|nr:uncharacterized protein PGTG_22282 [Puccinia graminis f. sp. tritici CRL 75-36-700-3]EHS64559.1 hypothetical protein PGTG_22282 [Puccinia graminis f. sp. tritici CRL 75-36-700-3]